MTSALSSAMIEQLSPLLASLARLVADGSALSEEELEILLVGVELDDDDNLAALAEVRRWGRLLKKVRQQPSQTRRRATAEALQMRGLLEAPVLLALALVTEGTSSVTIVPGTVPPADPAAATASPSLSASVTELDFGTLNANQPATASFEVQGGPGQIMVEGGQVRVMPLQFGAGSTQIHVEVPPMIAGSMIWSTIKLVTAAQTLDVPVIAEWKQNHNLYIDVEPDADRVVDDSDRNKSLSLVGEGMEQTRIVPSPSSSSSNRHFKENGEMVPSPPSPSSHRRFNESDDIVVPQPSPTRFITAVVSIALLICGIFYAFGQSNQNSSTVVAQKQASTPIAASQADEATNDSNRDCVAGSLFIADVTISDGSEVSAGNTFVKVWKVRNNGTCAWDSSYRLVFAEGEQLGPQSARLPAAAPGSEVNISLEMVAPTEQGRYSGTWDLRDGDNQSFGFVIVAINVPDTPLERPTATPEQASVPTKSPQPTLTSLCTSDSRFIADVTIPDGSEVSAGETFVKVWKVRNNGTCTWDSSYSLVFAEGEQLGPQSAQLPAAVPGEEANISLEMVAPTEPGRYRGTWQLRDGDNKPFDLLTVVINVGDTSTSSAPAVTAPAKSRLAFVSDREGNKEIYVMNADRSGLIRLTNNSAQEKKPVWSPDGTSLAFQSDRDGNWELYRINADGSGLIRLTNDIANDEWPAWSPSGEIWFQSNRTKKWNLFFMGADGSYFENFTNNLTHYIHPSWSSDGTRIVFAFREISDHPWNLYAMNANGGGWTRLTNSSTDTIQPAWSPNGRRIVFASPPKRGANFDIYVMNSDGSGVTNLTNHPDNDIHPVFKPDGADITFVSYREGNWEIYMMNPDGSGLKNLTNHPASDQWPAWSP